MCLKWVDDSRVPTTLSVASSARAMRLIAQLNVVVYANLALAIGFILSKQLTTGILDLVAFVYGWLLLRSEGHINSRLLSTYAFLSMLQLAFALVAFTLLISGAPLEYGSPLTTTDKIAAGVFYLVELVTTVGGIFIAGHLFFTIRAIAVQQFVRPSERSRGRPSEDSEAEEEDDDAAAVPANVPDMSAGRVVLDEDSPFAVSEALVPRSEAHRGGSRQHQAPP